ncbi:hypothetical protein ACIO3O_31005 [Streptomyces sp. NPDC087440]|uniref:hypothetical protein n=1 Tax=Streptomyces sp. NPDC087440 TaxID=3365790 RepID=UPI0038079C4A
MGPSQKVVGVMRVRGKSRSVAWAAAAVLALTASATACGDAEDPAQPPPSTASTPPPFGIDPQPSDSASASGPADSASAERQIRSNWQSFFDPNLTLDEKAVLLENGQTMKPVLKAFNGDKRGGQTSAVVKKVRLNSATLATVTYDLQLDGVPVLPNATGTSVLQDQKWKVSVKSLCALVKLSGNAAAPGC